MKKNTTNYYKLAFLLLALFFVIPVSADDDEPFVFTHPGGVHSLADLNRIKAKVLAQESPWIDGWNAMIADTKARSAYDVQAHPSLSGASGVRQRAARDATAAYYNFLRWYVTGNTAHGEAAVRILNRWSDSIKTVVSGELFQLPMTKMVQAAELLRIYPGWAAADQQRFKDMCINYFYPAAKAFIGECGGWSGWDGPANSAILYIGIFCDNETIFNEAIEYYKNGAGAGSLTNMVPHASGQVAEMGRDNPHAEIGPDHAAVLCQSAYNQGVDLFSLENNRLLAAFEYMCKYNLNYPIDWIPFNDCKNNNFYFPATLNSYRILEAPSYEIVYNHYVVRKGLQAPYTKAYLKLKGADHPISGEYPGYTAFAFTLDSALSPFTQMTLPPVPIAKATADIGRIRLSWDLPAGDLVNGTVIQRSTSTTGGFANFYEWKKNTSKDYVDTAVVVGTSYYYRLAFKNTAGQGAYSSVISATPVIGDANLPGDWTMGDIGNVPTAGSAVYYNGYNRSLTIKASGGALGARTGDIHGYAYKQVSGDVDLIVCLQDKVLTSNADRAGVQFRESLSPTAKMVSMGVGDNQFRAGLLAYRSAAGDNGNWAKGNTHTWTPTWFRLKRVGNAVTGYQSRDGVSWHAVSNVITSLPSVFYAGVFVNSGSSTNTALTTAYFDNLTLIEANNVIHAPTVLQATAVNSSRVNLEWSSVANPMGYVLKRATALDGHYETLVSYLTDTTYTDTNLDASTNYYYVVKSISFAGESPDSATVQVATPALAVPDAPTGLKLIPGKNRLHLSWNAVDVTDDFIIKRSSSANGTFTNIDTVAVENFNDINLTENTAYYYKVAGRNSVGVGAESQVIGMTLNAPEKLIGTIIGTPGSWENNPARTIDAVFDGNFGTYFDSDVETGAWVGIDLGRYKKAVLTNIKYAPRNNYPQRMVKGIFEQTQKIDFSDAVEVGNIAVAPPSGVLTDLSIEATQIYRAFRYVSPRGGWGNISELEFWGYTIDLPTQTINFQTIPSKNVGDADFDLVANATSGLPVTFTSSDPAIATVDNGKVHIVGAGTCTIYADQDGNGEFAPADQVAQILTVSSGASTELNQVSNINVYPNPFSDKIILKLEEENAQAQIDVYNLLGAKIISTTTMGSKIEIDLSAFPAGSYLLKVKTDKEYKPKVIVKK